MAIHTGAGNPRYLDDVGWFLSRKKRWSSPAGAAWHHSIRYACDKLARTAASQRPTQFGAGEKPKMGWRL